MRVVFVGHVRPVGKALLLYPLTLGISRRVWLHRVNRELDGHQALGLNHRLHAAMLAAPLAAIALFVILLSAGVALPWSAAVAAAVWLPSTVVTALTARRTARMLEGSGLRYGPWWLLWAATWVPVAGPMFFIAWEQTRLNRFWQYERGHPEHGIEVDLDLTSDPGYVAAMRQALRASYHAGSRFDRRRERRREVLRAVGTRWDGVQEERRAVRAAGGSTPVLPWRRPRPAPTVLLRVRCQCDHRFEVRRDPYAAVVVHCPKCGRSEVLPGLADDPLAPPQKGAYAVVRAECPDCGQAFSVPRNLHGPTPLVCPSCGRQDELPAPRPAAAE